MLACLVRSVDVSVAFVRFSPGKTGDEGLMSSRDLV